MTPLCHTTAQGKKEEYEDVRGEKAKRSQERHANSKDTGVALSCEATLCATFPQMTGVPGRTGLLCCFSLIVKLNSEANFLVNLIAGLIAYTYRAKKPFPMPYEEALPAVVF